MTGPIGIFDSGVGGLTVLQALESLLPHEDILYFADTAHFPYGNLTEAKILRHTTQAAAFLFTQNVKLLILACHTASIHSLAKIQKAFPIPILGVVHPSIHALRMTTRNLRVAVLATESTIKSNVYQKEIAKVLPTAQVFPVSCGDLAERIERGDSDTQKLIQACVKPLHDQDIDTVLLACTHYPHLKSAIEEELDPGTHVLNPALHIVEAATKMIKEPSLIEHKPHHTFFITGDSLPFETFLKRYPPKALFSLQEAIL